jgi:hypothetical protein
LFIDGEVTAPSLTPARTTETEKTSALLQLGTGHPESNGIARSHSAISIFW